MNFLSNAIQFFEMSFFTVPLNTLQGLQLTFHPPHSLQSSISTKQCIILRNKNMSSWTVIVNFPWWKNWSFHSFERLDCGLLGYDTVRIGWLYLHWPNGYSRFFRNVGSLLLEYTVPQRKFAQSVPPLTVILEAAGSNLGRDNDCPDKFLFSWFLT